VERGEGSPIPDADHAAQGAAIVADADAVFGEAEMIVKVKEPQAEEVARLESRHTLFTYLHLAPDPELTRGLVESGATCVAYETVEDARGRLPLLAPMSEVAGKIATQAGAFMLEKPLGGRGILLGGVPGVAAAKVMVIGGVVVGMNAGQRRRRQGHLPPGRRGHRAALHGAVRATPALVRFPLTSIVISRPALHPHVTSRAGPRPPDSRGIPAQPHETTPGGTTGSDGPGQERISPSKVKEHGVCLRPNADRLAPPLHRPT
jgi:hypothetical protein